MWKRAGIVVWSVAFAFAVAPLSRAGAAVPFAIDVGPGDASAIDASGQVVGTWTAHDRAYLWSQEQGLADLGWLEGTGEAWPADINDSGTIVGRSGEQAFSWTKAGGWVALGTLRPGDTYASAAAINASGQIAGTSSTNTGQSDSRAFLRQPAGGMVDLGVLPGAASSYAAAIDDHGDVAGVSGTSMPSYTGRAFLWTAAGGMVDLGTLRAGGTGNSAATGIDDDDQVVGYSDTDTAGVQHAFLWTQAGGMVDLGTLPGDTDSLAAGINAQGQVVGRSYHGLVSHAFIWTRAGGMADLGGLPGEVSTGASAINDRGQVVGSSGSHVVMWGADTTPPVARINLVHGQRIASFEDRGLRFNLTLTEPGTSVLALRRGGRIVAHATVAFTAPATKAVTLRIGHATRVQLRRHSRVRLSLRSVATDRAHNSAKVTRRITLRR